MFNFIASIKAIITRLVFAAHGVIAIWQVTLFKKNIFFWYLTSPILLLFFEGIFTLTIKENQEWKWFCPSVFLYLASVVPAIWLLELDKVDRRLKTKEETFNLTSAAGANLKELHNLIGVQIKLPEINLSTETWITLIEQFLMLILIIGRWMLPKGDLTRDQLSQILLVYIGTAADIIEFFDSFKDDKVASEPILVILTLAIWTWSLMQFTVVLTATKSRKSRLSSSSPVTKTSNSCCNIDVWGIVLNITLQDAPFLAFRLLIIAHYEIISYMNVFFTCKNTLVILLQLYRLHVVYSENRKQRKKKSAFELTSVSIISKPDMYGPSAFASKPKRHNREKSKRDSPRDIDDFLEHNRHHLKKNRKTQNSRKDTGYSTGSSYASARCNQSKSQSARVHKANSSFKNTDKERSKSREKQKLQRCNREIDEADEISDESQSESLSFYEEKRSVDTRKATPKHSRGSQTKKIVTTTSASNSSRE